MKKTYQDIQGESSMVSEPLAAYDVLVSSERVGFLNSERLLSDTVSVDEYFDELIALVRRDYGIL
jgi:hypothetical protein